MAYCPHCNSHFEVEDRHLGTLYTCASCNAVFFIDWNGQPEVADHSESSSPEPFPQESPTPESFSSEPPSSEPFVSDSFAGFPESSDQNFSPFVNAENFPLPEAAVTADPSYENSSHGEPLDSESEFVDYNSGTPNPADMTFDPGLPEYGPEDASRMPADITIPQPHIEINHDPSDLSDISDYANSEQMSSGITYSVVIEGIESFNIKNQLRDAMMDSRFGWDYDELLAGIHGGVLTLRKLTPIKASVLIGRIKYLPVRISWRQEILGGI